MRLPGRKRKHPPEKRGRNDFYPSLRRALNEAGLSTDGILFSVCGDMDNEQCLCDARIFFDEKGLYIVTGEEKLAKIKKNHTPVEPEFTLGCVKSIPLSDIDYLEKER